MTVQELIEKTKIHLGPLLDEKGAILYSSASTLVKGDLYTIGLNPGGEGGEALSEVLEQLPSRRTNAYIDEAWGNETKPYDTGRHPLQLNLTGLLNHLGYDPRVVFSSNLIFSRSPGQAGADYHRRAPIFWKVHEHFINIVDPKCFIVFGNSAISPFNYMMTRYQLAISDFMPSGHGSWNCYFCEGTIEGKKRVLIGVPHLSRYSITSHKNVMDWIKSKIH